MMMVLIDILMMLNQMRHQTYHGSNNGNDNDDNDNDGNDNDDNDDDDAGNDR